MLDVKMSRAASPAIGRARSQVARNASTLSNYSIEPFRAPPAPTDLQQRPQGTITGAAALSPMWGRCGADNSALPDERFGQEVLQGARFRVYAHAPLEERGYAAQIYYLRGCAALQNLHTISFCSRLYRIRRVDYTRTALT